MQRYAALVPVKPPARGKSRLGGLTGVPDEQRAALAEAFALDTLAACLATARVAEVLVATDDRGFAARAAALGASTVPDGPARGLNPVLRQAGAEAARRWPHLRPVAICADLPALRAADLEAALAAVDAGVAAYVADHTGTGTTLYTAPSGVFSPRFGPGSARAHRQAGSIQFLLILEFWGWVLRSILEKIGLLESERAKLLGFRFLKGEGVLI